MRRGTISRSISLILGLVLVATACSGTTAETTVPAPDDTAQEESTTSTTATSETTQNPGASRTVLNIVTPTDPGGTLNPYPQPFGNMIIAHSLMYHMLFDYDNENQIYSDVLEEWSMSDDATTATLRLRPDISWNDGVAMTSADVAMSLSILLDSRISQMANRVGQIVGRDAFVDGTADTISGITTPDDHTVLVELEGPDVAWFATLGERARLVAVWPSHVLGDVDHEDLPGHPFFESFPVSSGPYQFVQYVPDQYIEFEKNPSWSLGEPGFESVFLKIIGDTSSMEAQLEAGELQFMTTVPALAAQRLSEVDALTVESIAAPSADMFQLNYAEPRLADPRVRQALIFALDRQGICEQGLLGYCSFSLINNRLVGLEWAVPTEGVIEYNYDPERARQLLAEAGWDPNNEMRFLHRPGIESQDVAVTVAQANWAEVGVNVEIVNVDVPTLLETVADEGLREGVLGWTNAGANFSLDPAAAQAYHTCDLRYPAGSNLSWFCRPELDELWLEARGVVDQDARGDIYREIFRAINADPPEIYVFVADNIVAYDSRLKGVKPQGSAWNQYWNIGEWYWEE